MADSVIINGRRIPVPGNGVSGREILSQANPQAGRRAVIRNGFEAQTVDPNKNYSNAELTDKNGKPVKIDVIPDRTKGSFWAPRSALSKQIITEQVFDLAAKNFKSGVDFDEDNADWVVFPNFVLPKSWSGLAETTPLMIVFPTEYPQMPPIGFYLKGDIPNAPDGHFYQQAYHEAAKEPIEAGWKWFCTYVNPGSWRPAYYRQAGDWQRGDNLWTYLTLIKEVLATKGA